MAFNDNLTIFKKIRSKKGGEDYGNKMEEPS